MPTREELQAAMEAAAAAGAAKNDEKGEDAVEAEEGSKASRLSLSKAGSMIRRTNTAVRDVALLAGAHWAAPWDTRPSLPDRPDKWTACRFLSSLRDSDELGLLDHFAAALLDDPDVDDKDEDDTAEQLHYCRNLGLSRRQYEDPEAEFAQALRRRLVRALDPVAQIVAKGLTELAASADGRVAAAVLSSEAQNQAKFTSGGEAFVSAAMEDAIWYAWSHG